MENSSKLVTCTDVTGNPAPLGLMGFGMTTVLLNIHNLGVFELSAMILAMGIAYGGLAQVIAGIMEWKKGNTFATTAFISYGFFWLSLVLLILLPKMGLGSEPSNIALATYLIMWGLFTGVLYIATLKLTRALQFVFLSLTILFFLLAIGDITGNSTIKLIAAIVGVICGFSAIYTGLAQVINEVYKKDILPL
ncbi:MAG: acetate uptake transporter [Bacteroidia bacterium]|nr:acetate uptake transporter [Bacteroidia bacterium]MBT8270073.1 acetate uptake transporter [Bacteroidia bacterium]NNF81396.1 acetate uptake transporter [Flavobacteriaceae bacterium]NNK70700.1 acetate uptake transporter [Flavobacteriaceae bacterium]NNL81621.1 acetate uptake transporter [Flavobacteriaceae bacterium]